VLTIANTLSNELNLQILVMIIYAYSLLHNNFKVFCQALANNDTIPSQTNKETNKPSMKWVYRLFHGIHVLKLNLNNQMQNIVLNVNELLRRIVIYFGDFACNIYGVSAI
jgi:hypothetical protein